MTNFSKIASGLGVLLLTCFLSAATLGGGKSETAAADPLAQFEVGVGSLIVVMDKASDAGTPQKNIFEVRKVDGWHVLCHLAGKRDFPGLNRFVLNLEDEVFQVHRAVKKNK